MTIQELTYPGLTKEAGKLDKVVDLLRASGKFATTPSNWGLKNLKRYSGFKKALINNLEGNEFFDALQQGGLLNNNTYAANKALRRNVAGTLGLWGGSGALIGGGGLAVLGNKALKPPEVKAPPPPKVPELSFLEKLISPWADQQSNRQLLSDLVYNQQR